MSNYFFLTWKERSGVSLASAFPDQETGLAYELISKIEGKNAMPFDFVLREISDDKNGISVSNDLSGINKIWGDYQPNSFAWPLMSEKLKKVIEENLTGKEGIDWISCGVKGPREVKRYHILRFNKFLDVLDMKRTMLVKETDVIIKPILSFSKVKEYNIFPIATPGYGILWKIPSGIYVSEILKKAIQKEKITGVGFEKMSVSFADEFPPN